MNRLLLIIFLIVFRSTLLQSQNTIVKIVLDSETKQPIVNANVYILNNVKTGTITNNDGKFVLKNTNIDDIIEISHISYNNLKVKLNSLKSDTLMLSKTNIILDEITVGEISGKIILQNVIDSLVSNYSVKNLMYNAFVRSLSYEQDSSELYVLAEYFINTYQNSQDNSQFQIVKMRAKPFSITGKKYFKDMRVIDGIGNSSINFFQFRYDFLKRKKLKKYNVKIIHENDEFFKIKIITKKYFTHSILIVDKVSYAIKKMILYYSKSEDRYIEIGFKQVKNKWYPDYKKVMYNTELFSKWKPNTIGIKEVIAIYNIDNKTKYIKENFKSFVNIIAEPVKYHIGDWSDEFWENYNYIPLPDWIKQELYKGNSH